MKIFSLLTALVPFLFFGCNYKMNKDISEANDITPAVSASQVSFALVNQYVFAKSCISCHSSPKNAGNINLETYASAAGYAGQIKADVDSNKMPKSPLPGLTAKQKALLNLWINQGMPEQAGGSGAPPPVLEPKFASIKAGIFHFKCDSCHNPQGKAKNLHIDSPADFMTGQNILVVPGKPEKSKLVRVITPGAKKQMPPKNSDVAPVTPEELAAITAWVSDGAKDDSTDPNSKFQAIQKGIIDKKCTKCHEPFGKAEDVPLSTLNDLVGGGPAFLVPGSPDESRLMTILGTGPNRSMPPANSGVAPLTEVELRVISEWIKSGATQ